MCFIESCKCRYFLNKTYGALVNKDKERLTIKKYKYICIYISLLKYI